MRVAQLKYVDEKGNSQFVWLDTNKKSKIAYTVKRGNPKTYKVHMDYKIESYYEVNVTTPTGDCQSFTPVASISAYTNVTLSIDKELPFDITCWGFTIMNGALTSTCEYNNYCITSFPNQNSSVYINGKIVGTFEFKDTNIKIINSENSSSKTTKVTSGNGIDLEFVVNDFLYANVVDEKDCPRITVLDKSNLTKFLDIYNLNSKIKNEGADTETCTVDVSKVCSSACTCINGGFSMGDMGKGSEGLVAIKTATGQYAMNELVKIRPTVWDEENHTNIHDYMLYSKNITTYSDDSESAKDTQVKITVLADTNLVKENAPWVVKVDDTTNKLRIWDTKHNVFVNDSTEYVSGLTSVTVTDENGNETDITQLVKDDTAYIGGNDSNGNLCPSLISSSSNIGNTSSSGSSNNYNYSFCITVNADGSGTYATSEGPVEVTKSSSCDTLGLSLPFIFDPFN